MVEAPLGAAVISLTGFRRYNLQVCHKLDSSNQIVALVLEYHPRKDRALCTVWEPVHGSVNTESTKLLLVIPHAARLRLQKSGREGATRKDINMLIAPSSMWLVCLGSHPANLLSPISGLLHVERRPCKSETENNG